MTHSFENVRWTDTPEERVYVVENSAYKIQALGIKKAVDIIQSMGLPEGRPCKLIVTNYNVPQVSLTYQPLTGDTTVVSGEDWKVSYSLAGVLQDIKQDRGRVLHHVRPELLRSAHKPLAERLRQVTTEAHWQKAICFHSANGLSYHETDSSCTND